jgi:hypothetical protein
MISDEAQPAVCGPKINNGNGFTKREMAAIMLRVPDSGKKWLDDMIRQSQEFDTEFLHD